MSENTKIEWCDHTFNPWERCQKIGPGCDHCYAETRNARFGGGTAVNWGPGAPRRRTSPANWRKPLQWNRDGTFYAIHGRRQRVFCASLADVFDNAVDPGWREDLFALIRSTPNLDWLLLTKRIGNVPAMISIIPGWLPDNVWLGATIVNQEEADRDIPKLLAVPARVRFLSMEPLLGPVDLRLPTRIWTNSAGGSSCDHCCNGDRCDDPTHCERGRPDWHVRCPYCRGTGRGKPIDWVIVGGESGASARPMHPKWARDLRDQCTAAGVPFLFKQWGEWREPVEGERYDTTMGRAQRMPAFIVSKTGTVHCFENDQTRDGGRTMLRVGKRAAGRMLDGHTHDEFPEA
ncbi:phage Gp37/Gp68 family protein [Burkholderia cenocepacia]|uniref:phage Gp37/Gp68 family protein n=1 Tax=Burkholderia cenocepacia TaxID=95486 RepID=UPI00222E2016|nr:phage Gp37/Gp68 family protein [Burkholderia cenocepacia]MCW3657582.1 phage Gp37/Gp68 family protein [Burkholderia cenocepacia]